LIARAFITEWQAKVPWPDPVQVEQDLILSRLVVEIAEHKLLADELAFRGGTALHKLHLPEPLRYSEDLDYVRTNNSPVGDQIDALRAIGEGMGLTMGRRQIREDMVTIFFSAAPTLGVVGSRIRVKIETNQAETEALLDRPRLPYRVESRWWSGAADVLTFELEELMGTKMRALYQRSKGRDLFDLWHVLDDRDVDDKLIIAALDHYMKDRVFSYRQLRPNLRRKLDDPDFVADLAQLVITPPSRYEIATAANLVMDRLGSRLRNAPALDEIADGRWREQQ
jgi:predicted nucleotidyltransferase component of viral defense system